MRYTLKSPVDVYLSLCCEEDYPRNPEAAKRWHVAKNRGETWIMDENGDTVASVEREDAANLIAAVPALVAVCEELLEVAALRGDNVLPHPCDDPKLWNARMQTAWDELQRIVDEAKGGD